MSGDEEDTDIRDSTPNAGGPEGAAGDMGVSSERVGPTGPGQESTDGTRPTFPEVEAEADPESDPESDTDTLPEQRPGHAEENPEGIKPKAGYPSLDPRSNSS